MGRITRKASLLLLLETVSLLAGLLLVALALSVTASASGPGDPVSIRSIERIALGPSPLDPFRRPCGLVTDPQRGIIVVADNGRGRVVFLDESGRSRGSLSWDLQDPGHELGAPRGVALTQQGHVCVVSNAGSVEVLTTTGSHLGFLEFDEIPGVPTQPRAVALSIGASGRFYVLRTGARNQIVILEPNGTLVRTLSFDDKVLETPVSLAVNPEETLLAVADPQAMFQIKFFDLDGVLLDQFGPHGTGAGTLSLAVDVTWGPEQTLWVTDTMRHSIAVFDAQGKHLDRVGGFGRGPGQFNYPAACEFLDDGRLVVLERAGGRIQIVDLDMSLPGSSAFEAIQPANAVGDTESFVSRGKVKER